MDASALEIPALVAAYLGAPARLRHAIADLTPAELQRSPASGQWSIHEIVVHLCDTEIPGAHRIMKAIAEPGSLLTAYDQTAFASELQYRRRDLTTALQAFETLRRATTDLLRRIPADAWVRSARHEEAGEMTARALVARLVDHSERHLTQIGRLREWLGKPAAGPDDEFDESLSDA